jgi:hypothetical protein
MARVAARSGELGAQQEKKEKIKNRAREICRVRWPRCKCKLVWISSQPLH